MFSTIARGRFLIFLTLRYKCYIYWADLWPSASASAEWDAFSWSTKEDREAWGRQG